MKHLVAELLDAHTKDVLITYWFEWPEAEPGINKFMTGLLREAMVEYYNNGRPAYEGEAYRIGIAIGGVEGIKRYKKQVREKAGEAWNDSFKEIYESLPVLIILIFTSLVSTLNISMPSSPKYSGISRLLVALGVIKSGGIIKSY